MTSRTGWTVARLAKDAGIARSTVFRWIAEGAGGITIDSVFRVADALEVSRGEALRAASNLPAEDDPEIRLIIAADRPEAIKAEMISRLLVRRGEETARRLADLEWMLSQAKDEAV